jgi:hypothetical protein
VIIFDEYQKREIIDLKTRVTSNVLPNRNPRERPRKDLVTVTPTPNHKKINLKEDRTDNEEPGIFLYMEIFKRQPILEPESSSHSAPQAERFPHVKVLREDTPINQPETSN